MSAFSPDRLYCYLHDYGQFLGDIARKRLRLLIRTVVCPFVCPSVTLRHRDHIGWSSSKVFSWLVSLKRSVSALQTPMSHLLQREHPKLVTQSGPPPPVNLSVADIRRQIAAEWSEIAQWSQWRAYHHRSFE